jgi:hypothetical protein
MNPASVASELDWMDRIFGDQAFATLFALYGEGRFDRYAFEEGKPAPTDKELALYRLHRQLGNYERLVDFAPVLKERKDA